MSLHDLYIKINIINCYFIRNMVLVLKIENDKKIQLKVDF